MPRHEGYLPMKVCRLKPGRSYSFLYPRHNYKGADDQCELRRVRVISVRDTIREPVESKFIRLNPGIRRGRWLVIAQDLDKGSQRMFYDQSIKNVREICVDDLDTLPGHHYCVIDGPRIAHSSVTLSESIAFQLGSGRGVVCAVLVREPITEVDALQPGK